MAIPQEVLAYGWIPFTVVVVVSNTSAIESFWAKLAANFVHWTLLCLLSLARKTNETLRPAWLQGSYNIARSKRLYGRQA